MSIDFNLQNLTHLFWTVIIVLNLYVALLLFRMSKVYRAERSIKLIETANIKEHIEFMRSRPNKSVSSCLSATGDFTTRSRFFEQFLDAEPPQLRSCMQVRPNFRSNSSTTAADEDPMERRGQRVRQNDQQLIKPRSKQLQMGVQRNYNTSQQQRPQQHNQKQIKNQPRHRYEEILKEQSQQLRKPNVIEQTSSEETPCNGKLEDEHTLYISDSFGRVVHEIPFRECDYMDALQVVLGDQRWKIKKAWNDRSKTNKYV